MKYLIIFTLTFFGALNLHSQTYEIGGFIGGANAISDVGRTTYISPNTLAIGGIAKWNRSPRHSFRASIITTNLSGEDSDSNQDRREQRGFSFENRITEFSLGLEFTFWEFSTYSGNRASTPYLYSGITYLTYDALRLTPDTGEIVKFDSAGDFAIPMVVGFKTTVSTNAIAAFEIGARYTFSDSLDGSVAPDGEFEDARFGDTNNNDWYVFTGITLTFSVGRQPCYGNF